MEVCLHDSGNVFSINSLNTIIANAMESTKLGEASFDEYAIFSPPSFEENFFMILCLQFMMIIMIVVF